MVAPVLGIPVGTKQTGQRVDFRPTQFDLLIETKGYLLAWTRMSICPCTSGSPQSDQPDPNCTLCDGSGLLYFGSDTAQDLTDYTFTDLQQSILDDSGALVIRGVITNMSSKQDRIDKASNWVEGSMSLSVRAENKIGHFDRLVALDAKVVYTEHIKADGTALTKPRYPIVEMSQIRSLGTSYVLDTDYELTASGSISWLLTPPAEDTVLSLHYICHPTWIVVDHPHVARVTSRIFKTPTPTTPTGDAVDLPTQATVLYEFLL